MACGVRGFGDWISDCERGRPLGMSTDKLRLSRWDSLLEVCLLSRDDLCELDLLSRLDECLEELVLYELDLEDDDVLDNFSCGTSRMFRIRPVVGSVVEFCPGS